MTTNNNNMNNLKQQIIDGELDIYDIHTRSSGEEQKKLSKEIQEAFDVAYVNHRLHPDDDACEIYDLIINSW